MTVYAPAEQQPKLGRRRDELTEVRVGSLGVFLIVFLLSSFNIVHRSLWSSPQDAFNCIFLILIVSVYRKEFYYFNVLLLCSQGSWNNCINEHFLVSFQNMIRVENKVINDSGKV